MNGKNSKPYPDADEFGADDPTEPSFDRDDVGTGRVKFDDRGNAVWEWAVSTGAFGNELSPERLQKLEHPALSIADEPQPVAETVRANPLGTKKGYDPYDSGKLGKAAAAPRKKKDLRRLGEFLKLKKQAASNKQSED
ncbi:MAG TPA: hypothetical protein VGE92_10815 [Steroidobacteraceae bacterium]